MVDLVPKTPHTINHLADEVRRLTIEMINSAGGGHFGGALSCVDVLAAVFARFGCDAHNPETDKVVLSKGHAAAAYYACLAVFSAIERSRLADFCASPAQLQGHPDMAGPDPVTFSTGSLGQGFSAALGMAVMLKAKERRVAVILGDGECQEGQVWEAAMLAARLGLNNLTAIVDCNGLQEWGYRSGPRRLDPVLDMGRKWDAFGWHVLSCDGHDHAAIDQALAQAQAHADNPSVILAKTVKGHGVSFIEADPDRFHSGAISLDEFRLAMAELGA